MPLKIGGGNKLQNYSNTNGEYIDECTRDHANLFANKVLNEKDKPVIFPKANVHNKQYIKNYFYLCVNKNDLIIDSEKYSSYLLVHKEVNDKSRFLNNLGFNLSNIELLDKYIRKTSFNLINVKTNFQVKPLLSTKTILPNLKTGKTYNVKTVWEIQENNFLRFITLCPEEFIYEDD